MKKYSLINNTDNKKNENPSQLVFIINSKSIKKGLKFLLVFVIFYLVFLLTPYIKSLLFSLGISFILSFLLSPLADSLENHGLNRTAAAILIFLIFITTIVLGMQFLIPSISQEVKSISEFIQNENAESIIKKLQVILAERFPALQKPEIAEKVSTKLHTILMDLIQKSSNIIRSVLSSFMLIITIPFITFFFLKDGRRIKKYIIQLVPNRYFEMSLNLIHKSNQKLGAYIRGQLLVSFVIGSLSVLALFLLNIPYFFIIGILAGLANMIPYFGPLVGATPGVIIAFIETGSTGTMVGVIVAFALIQLIDNVLVSPLIVSRSVQIHPLLVILALLLGSSLGGILGMLVAIPVFAVIQVIIKEIIWSFKNYRLTG
ncbi:AI-2E family transporter [candidate division KSB1 bacterium]|nr:AI-2E family transporter [candidate division KSB1 bacterium]